MPLGTDPSTLTPPDHRYPDNPGPDDLAKMKVEDGPFFICHTNIGNLKPGDVIAAVELGPNAQIERLLSRPSAGGSIAMSVASPEHVDAYKKFLANTTAPTRPPDPWVAPKVIPPVNPAKPNELGTHVTELGTKPPDAATQTATQQTGGFSQSPKSGNGGK